MNEPLNDVRAFRLPPQVVDTMQRGLADVAAQTVAAITAQVPAYGEAFGGETDTRIEEAVRGALGTLLDLVSRGSNQGTRLAPALEAAYALGRGEARSGRSLDALLAAYRIGARVAWRELATISVGAGQAASAIALFAELVFAYIDELSAASVAGHADELATSGRVRIRQLERLAQALVAGEPQHVVVDAAERAEWVAPHTLTAVLLPEGAARATVGLLDARTLQLAEPDLEVPEAPEAPETSVLLVPDVHGASRAHLLRLLEGRGAVVGPSRPWLQVRSSLDQAVRASRLAEPRAGGAVVDTEDHLVALIVTADVEARADLRTKVLSPLAGERDPVATKLVDTLRSWLLHQGRREKVAAELFVHPQTVRYRMARLRELYGERLHDPDWLLRLTLALAVAPGPGGRIRAPDLQGP